MYSDTQLFHDLTLKPLKFDLVIHCVYISNFFKYMWFSQLLKYNFHSPLKTSQYAAPMCIIFLTTGGGKQSGRSSESPLPPSAERAAATRQRHQPQEQLKQMEAADVPKKMFNPFCSVDGMQLSIHCHINAVKTLVCAPGQVAKDRKSVRL